MRRHWKCALVVLSSFVLLSTSIGQTSAVVPAATAKSEPQPTATKVDVDELIEETQQSVKGSDWSGLVWWIPTDFWLAAAAGSEAQFQSLDEYTVVMVGIGKVGAFGNINFIPSGDLRKNIVLRDSAGTEYQPVEKVSADAEMLTTIIRPMFAKLLGSMGENLDIIFFPAKTKSGAQIANPKQKGAFSFAVKNVMGKEHAFSWNTPLNSMQAPKFCPIGKERVNANWNFCPWHGVALGDKP